ncbi:Rz family phage endopeptidase [Hafnia alvei ATCC 13337]|nr:Rz family phage endopeptidase [Hafnia alvei ATCC 13337]
MVVVLANLSLWVGHYTGYRDADKSWQLKWAQRNKADSDALAKRQVGERAEEQRRQQAANQAVKDAEKDNEQLKADAINAKRSADRLQQQLAQLRQQFADSETGKLSSAASSSASKSQAIILLTQLLSESNEAAGEYAKEADRAYSAGKTCERVYDKVSGQ